MLDFPPILSHDCEIIFLTVFKSPQRKSEVSTHPEHSDSNCDKLDLVKGTLKMIKSFRSSASIVNGIIKRTNVVILL